MNQVNESRKRAYEKQGWKFGTTWRKNKGVKLTTGHIAIGTDKTEVRANTREAVLDGLDKLQSVIDKVASDKGIVRNEVVPIETDHKITVEEANEARDKRISELHAEKIALLDKYGVFGGGPEVNDAHNRINKQLEALGIKEND